MKRVTSIIQVEAPVSSLYEAWRRLEAFGEVTRSVESVRRLPDGRSEWTARGPFRKRVRWQAMVTEDVPNTRLRWQSIGGDVALRGLAEFIPAAGGSVLMVVFEYQPPLGLLGKLAAFFGDLEGRVEADIERLCRFVETGVATAPAMREAVRRGREGLATAGPAG
jgi:uncharacterized membrane protein